MTFYPIAALYPLLHKNVTKPIKYKSVPIIANSYHDLRDCEIYEISEQNFVISHIELITLFL